MCTQPSVKLKKQNTLLCLEPACSPTVVSGSPCRRSDAMQRIFTATAWLRSQSRLRRASGQTITVRLAPAHRARFWSATCRILAAQVVHNSSGYPVRIMAPCFCQVSNRDRESGGFRKWRAAQQTMLGDQPHISVLPIRVNPLCIFKKK